MSNLRLTIENASAAPSSAASAICDEQRHQAEANATQDAPAVSVCMPAYNCQRYVAESVESVLGQSFRDFEFLIIDDGSTDGTLQILEYYAARDPASGSPAVPTKVLRPRSSR